MRGRPAQTPPRLICAVLVLLALACNREPDTRLEQVDTPLPPAVADVLKDMKKGFNEQIANVLSGRTSLVSMHAHRDELSWASSGAQRLNVRFGRTSNRLRHPANEAPLWAERTVDKLSDEKVHRLDRSAYHYDLGTGRYGYMEAIGAATVCTRCHGRDKDLHPHVKEVIQKRYPEDQAVNYRAGDLRGWFWLEYDVEKAE